MGHGRLLRWGTRIVVEVCSTWNRTTEDRGTSTGLRTFRPTGIRRRVAIETLPCLSLDPLPAVVCVTGANGRLDLPVEVVCNEKAEFATFLNEHIHGQPDVAHVEVMTRIDMFGNQLFPGTMCPGRPGALGRSA